MKRVRCRKVKLYDGISEFAMTRDWGSQVNFYAYNILKPDHWKNKRDSYFIFSINNDGLYANIREYRALDLKIELDSNKKIYFDGTDFT